jgi:hypothetical protein
MHLLREMLNAMAHVVPVERGSFDKPEAIQSVEPSGWFSVGIILSNGYWISRDFSRVGEF